MKKQRKCRSLQVVMLIMFLMFPLTVNVAGDTLDELEGQRRELSSDVAELNDRLQIISDSLSETQMKIDEKNNEIATTQEEIDSLTQLAQEQRDAMAKRIQYTYENGNASYIELLFEAESFADFMNRAEYVRTIHDYDREQLKAYQTTLVSLAEEQTALEAARWELEESLLAHKAAKEEAETLLAGIQTKIAETDEQIASAQEEEDRQNQTENPGNGNTADENTNNPPLNNSQPDNPPSNVSSSDLALLAAIIECEAGGEGYEGRIAVGSVVLNRVDSPYFPNTILEVLYQKNQFSPIASGKFAKVLARGAEPSCVQAANEVLNGTRSLDCLYFRLNNGQFDGIVIGNIVFF